MKKLRNIIVCFLAISLFITGLPAFAATPTPAPANNCILPDFLNPPQENLVEVSAIDENHVRPLGRMLPVDGAAYLAYPMSGIEFEVQNATEVYLKVAGGGIHEKASSRYQPITYDLLAMSIDDSDDYVLFHMAFFKFKQERYVRIAKFDAPGNHKIRLMTVTGPEVELRLSGVAAVNNSPSDGTLAIKPSQKRNLQIEMIGDSGMVAMDIMNTSDDLARYDETWMGYVGIMARHYDADVSVAAIGGGFLEDKGQTQNAHGYYYLASPHWMTWKEPGWAAKADEFTYDEDYLWDFSRFKPDLVVVNLGSNNYQYTTYKAYVEFHHRIRKAYCEAYGEEVGRNIPILFVLGAAWQNPYEKQIVRAVNYIKDPANPPADLPDKEKDELGNIAAELLTEQELEKYIYLGDQNVFCGQIGEGYGANNFGHPFWWQQPDVADLLIGLIDGILFE